MQTWRTCSTTITLSPLTTALVTKTIIIIITINTIGTIRERIARRWLQEVAEEEEEGDCARSAWFEKE